MILILFKETYAFFETIDRKKMLQEQEQTAERLSED